jgi:hypothetical protein
MGNVPSRKWPANTLLVYELWDREMEPSGGTAADPKELMIIPNADHVDLYDRIDRIPFDTIAAFSRKAS